MRRAARELIDTVQRMSAAGLLEGTSGNLSVRLDQDLFLITPSGVPYEELEPEDLVPMDLDGNPDGRHAPSSEWRIHRDVYRRRKDADAVVHTHSPWATSLSALRRDLPPFHYMIVLGGGFSVRCATYATYGTQELSDAALAALERRRVCLLANHGLLALGSTLDRARKLAAEVELLCRVYLQSLPGGEPVLLTANELRQAGERFATYGGGWPLLDSGEEEATGN